METKQIFKSDVEWTDLGDYLSIGMVMERVGTQYSVSVVQAGYLRNQLPTVLERFYFGVVDEDTFMMSDENDESLGLVTDIRKAALDEWGSREEARAEASL